MRDSGPGGLPESAGIGFGRGPGRMRKSIAHAAARRAMAPIPARDKTSMPMRSASYSFSRVKLICPWIAAAWPAVEIAPAASVETSVVAAIRIDAIEAAMAAMLLRCWS